jgi:hypothetical protein
MAKPYPLTDDQCALLEQVTEHLLKDNRVVGLPAVVTMGRDDSGGVLLPPVRPIDRLATDPCLKPLPHVGLR